MTINATVYFKKISTIEHSRGQGYNAVLEAEMEDIDVEESFSAEQIVSEMDNESLLKVMELSEIIEFVESNGYVVNVEE